MFAISGSNDNNFNHFSKKQTIGIQSISEAETFDYKCREGEFGERGITVGRVFRFIQIGVDRMGHAGKLCR